MSAKHTPESWVAQPGENFITDGQGIVICQMHRHHPDAQVNASARLIAAAPDLLEALIAMRDEFRALDLPYGSKAYCQATSAINKATWGSK